MAVTIRLAQHEDRAAITACVRAAYAGYITRMGMEPAPIRADYARLIVQGVVSVISDGADIRGVVVCFAKDDHYFLENIAINPADQGQGLGCALMRFVEDQARAAGLNE